MEFRAEWSKLIETQPFCFLGSITENGYPMIRAMLKPIKIEDNQLYLHTNTSSNKVHQLLENPKACLYFYDGKTFTGVSLIGEMEVLSEEQDKREFWQESYDIYYEKGGGLPDFTVLKLTIIEGEFYQNFNVLTF